MFWRKRPARQERSMNKATAQLAIQLLKEPGWRMSHGKLGAAVVGRNSATISWDGKVGCISTGEDIYSPFFCADDMTFDARLVLETAIIDIIKTSVRIAMVEPDQRKEINDVLH